MSHITYNACMTKIVVLGFQNHTLQYNKIILLYSVLKIFLSQLLESMEF